MTSPTIAGMKQTGTRWTRAEVWYFTELPALIDVGGCVAHDGRVLLYVGISPKAPPRNGRASSRQTLRSRLRSHYAGNAAGSTLRLTLGACWPTGSGCSFAGSAAAGRQTFVEREFHLSAWMADHAEVVWAESGQPWLVERELITRVDLPLNLDQNRGHPFHGWLSGVRADAAHSPQPRPYRVERVLDLRCPGP